jgi:hypothetical protein
MNTTSTDLDALLGTGDPVLSEVSWLAWNAWALAVKNDAPNELVSALLKASHAAVEAASASYWL